MLYKSILKVVGVVAVVAAMLLMGCVVGDDPDNPNINSSVTKGTFTDSRDGKSYNTIKIGTQTWFAENLNYDVPDDTTDVCYENSAGNCDKYGRLYSLDAAKVVCPVGWRLPGYNEWQTLIDYVGGSSDSLCIKLKSKSGWYNDCNGTDKYGFSALPGGYGSSVYSGGYNFYSGGVESYWWSATDGQPIPARPVHGLGCNMYDRLHFSSVESNRGGDVFSIRCLQN